jgi:hypothetical protein
MFKNKKENSDADNNKKTSMLFQDTQEPQVMQEV